MTRMHFNVNNVFYGQCIRLALVHFVAVHAAAAATVGPRNGRGGCDGAPIRVTGIVMAVPALFPTTTTFRAPVLATVLAGFFA